MSPRGIYPRKQATMTTSASGMGSGIGTVSTLAEARALSAEFAPPVTLDDVGDPEPTELEVQQALEAADEQARLATVVAEAEKAPVAPPVTVPVAPEGLHPLDVAPLGSKIVVVEDTDPKAGRVRVAILGGPPGNVVLTRIDPAQALPVGARIEKRWQSGMEGVEGAYTYRAVQLSPAVDCPPLECSTAAECIRRFIHHFHGEPWTRSRDGTWSQAVKA